jgi:hypothetical protein
VILSRRTPREPIDIHGDRYCHVAPQFGLKHSALTAGGLRLLPVLVALLVIIALGFWKSSL